MFRRIDTIPTKHLKHIVEHDGLSLRGVDYGPYLEEIRHVLFQRATAQDAKAYDAAVRAQNSAFHTCTDCKLTIDRADQTALDKCFSKRGDDKTKYRHLCKLCRSNREKQRAANTLPF